MQQKTSRRMLATTSSPNAADTIQTHKKINRIRADKKTVLNVAANKINESNINPTKVNVSQNVPRKQATQVCVIMQTVIFHSLEKYLFMTNRRRCTIYPH